MKCYLCLVVMVIGCLGFSSCTRTEVVAEPGVAFNAAPLRDAAVDQLIVKFRRDLDPLRPGYVDELSRYAGIGLRHVRTISGGAHVFRLEHPLAARQAQAILERLNQRPDVQYAEPDSRVYGN